MNTETPTVTPPVKSNISFRIDTITIINHLQENTYRLPFETVLLALKIAEDLGSQDDIPMFYTQVGEDKLSVFSQDEPDRFRVTITNQDGKTPFSSLFSISELRSMAVEIRKIQQMQP